jgi:hypothetical protein
MAAREPWRSCYTELTAGAADETMDYPPRVLARLRLLCPDCPYYLACYARALLREAGPPVETPLETPEK